MKKKRLKKTIQVIQTHFIYHFMKWTSSFCRSAKMGQKARRFLRIKNKEQITMEKQIRNI